MDEKERTCFFISPIGEEGSVERRNSDHVLYFLLIPVLSRFRFNTESLRSDEDYTASITKEMRKRLREGDLCVADITGHNPNVMWECGYRTAVGGELIVLCAEDDTKERVKPVFDMYDDRKILYDSCTSEKGYDGKRLRATQQEICERVQKFIDKESKNQPDSIDGENAEIFQILKSQNEILEGHTEMLEGFRNSLLSIERRLDVPYK